MGALECCTTRVPCQKWLELLPRYCPAGRSVYACAHCTVPP
ncbi:hypothetical protein ARZXY2_2693 [Arthrobacter sp. ZXY-2]|nr:hypothetical protein ARZXY2_2693 [Arthrobacter sp. ZXY-2]